jgi:hypothetical protein
VSTRLVIHQNLSGPPTFVELDAHGIQPPLPNLALSGATCQLLSSGPDPDTGLVSGVLTLRAPLASSGTLPVSSVEATVHVDGALWGAFPVDVAGGEVAVSDHYEGVPPSEVVVTVDSATQVVESSEDDNAAAAQCPV